MADNEQVQLNVGGKMFTTSVNTLRAQNGSLLAEMFTPPYSCPYDKEKGIFFIDRNGSCFEAILDYLRSGTLIVPRDPVEYTALRRECRHYRLSISNKLPHNQMTTWEAAPVRFKHAHIVFEDLEKTIDWEEGALPSGLREKSVFEIVSFFTGRGYKVVSEYTNRGTKGYVSLWLAKREVFPGADVAIEMADYGEVHDDDPVPVADSFGKESNFIKKFS